MDKDLVFGDPKAPRFVFWNKKLRPTPSGPDVLTFDLLSIWGKIRAGLGAAGVKKPLPGVLSHCFHPALYPLSAVANLAFCWGKSFISLIVVSYGKSCLGLVQHLMIRLPAVDLHEMCNI